MRQIDLFSQQAGLQPDAELPLTPEVLQAWQERVLAFQQQQRQQPSTNTQGSLFKQPEQMGQPPDPLSLPPQHLQFWRWPESLQQGAALYFVIDHSRGDGHELLLYVGETCQADRRWKGEHDCKQYLAAYGEAWCAAANSPASRSASGVMPRLMRAPADGWNNSKFAIGCRPLTRSAASAGRHRSRATSTNQAAPVRSRDQSVAPS